jgi:hypothetical protein
MIDSDEVAHALQDAVDLPSYVPSEGAWEVLVQGRSR